MAKKLPPERELLLKLVVASWLASYVMVAMPRLLKTPAGKLPVGVLIPMMAGSGPLGAFSGWRWWPSS